MAILHAVTNYLWSLKGGHAVNSSKGSKGGGGPKFRVGSHSKGLGLTIQMLIKKRGSRLGLFFLMKITTRFSFEIFIYFVLTK